MALIAHDERGCGHCLWERKLLVHNVASEDKCEGEYLEWRERNILSVIAHIRDGWDCINTFC
jgi:hypothetical protein